MRWVPSLPLVGIMWVSSSTTTTNSGSRLAAEAALASVESGFKQQKLAKKTLYLTPGCHRSQGRTAREAVRNNVLVCAGETIRFKIAGEEALVIDENTSPFDSIRGLPPAEVATTKEKAVAAGEGIRPLSSHRREL